MGKTDTSIQFISSKWKGLLIGPLKKITEQVHPALNDEVLEYVELLIIKCLEIFTLRQSQLKTVHDIEDQIKTSLPKLIELQVIEYAKTAVTLKKNDKKYTSNLPIHTIYNLIQREIPQQYKLDDWVVMYTTAILEYISVNLLKLAGDCVKNMHHVEISFQDLRVPIYEDKILMDLFSQYDDDNDLILSNYIIDKIPSTANYGEVFKGLMNDEQRFIKDLHPIFKDKINHINPVGSLKIKLDNSFKHIKNISKVARLLSSLNEHIVFEHLYDKPVIISCGFKELTETAEFIVSARYANDIVKKQCRNIFSNVFSKPEVLTLILQSPGYSYKEVVKNYFPKLLLFPFWYELLYFEYIKIVYQFSSSKLDEIYIEQMKGTLRPLKFQISTIANKVNIQDNFKEFELKINATPSRFFTIQKLRKVQKSIDGLDSKHMKYCYMKFMRESVFREISRECKVVLFDDIQKYFEGANSQLVGGFSKFNLKEELFIRKMEFVDRESIKETNNIFERVSRLWSPIITNRLVTNSLQGKANNMTDSIILKSKNMMDITFNSMLQDKDKKCPLILYLTDLNKIIEGKRNNCDPFIKGAIFWLPNTMASFNYSHKKLFEDAQKLAEKFFEKSKDQLGNKTPPCVTFIEEIHHCQYRPDYLYEEPAIKTFNCKNDIEVEKYLIDKPIGIESKNKLTKCLNYTRKWPDLNLKSPGNKPKINIRSACTKDNNICEKTSNDAPPIPPRLSQQEKALILLSPLKVKVPRIPPRPESKILQNLNSNKISPIHLIDTSIEPIIKPVLFPKYNNNCHMRLTSKTKLNSKFSFQPFVLKRTVPCMFQFNI